MTLAILVFSGGLIYWLGLITRERWVIGTGLASLILTLGVTATYSGSALFAMTLLLAGVLLGVVLQRDRRLRWQIPGWTLLVILVLALGFRVIPGFEPVPTVQTDEHLFRFPPEKLLLILLVPGMVLIPWSVSKRRPPHHPARIALAILSVTLTIVTPLAWFGGWIAPGLAPQSLEYLSYWLAYNLIYTCLLEESFFRGIVQTALIRGFNHRLSAQAALIAGVLTASLLFGLTHLGGGPLYIGLATLAGIGYGFAYELTGRLHYAVLVHFAVNAVQLLFFAGATDLAY